MRYSDPNDLRRWLTLLTRNAGAQPIANDGLVYQGSNQAEWLDLATLYVPLGLWDQNGFIDRTLSTIAFNDGALRLTIAPTGATYDFIQAGITYTSAGDTFDISNVNGLHMIYYDGGVLAEIVNPTEAQVDTAIEEYCLVAMVMWDVTGATGYLMDERHGMRMSPVTHHWIHDAVGAVWLEGLALGNFTIGAGAANADAQFSTSAGAIYDEDIRHELTAVAVGTGLQIWYLAGANWRWTTNAGYSILLDAGTGRMAYNNAGAQAPVNNNQFALCHVFATNGTDLEPIAIQGQAQYATLNQARDGAETEIANLVTGTLPLPEIKPLGTVIFQTANAYGNAVLSRVRTTGAGDNYVDWRTSPITASSPGTDHGALAGLADDDHLQYALLAGRAGGQILIGGDAAGEDLLLQSTSHATRGHVIFGSAGTTVYDEVNDRVGIGTATIPHGAVGRAKFAIDGPNASTALGPHIQHTTDADDYPLFQFLNWSHDDIEMSFDAYWTGTWRSSDVGSNFQLIKTGNVIRWQYDSAVAAGNIVTWNSGMALTAAGLVGIGTSVPAAAAKMEILSTTGGLLLPRMTTPQRLALAAVNGLMVYDSTVGAVYAYEAGAWVNI